MSLQEVIDTHGLDPEGVGLYLAEARFAAKLGRRIDPTALRLTKRSWPSRFTPEYTQEVYRVRTALARYVKEAA